jgi:hypothetical protein
MKYGPVRTTFTIQLASFFGVISPQHGSYSEIEKGTSGYYRCVNGHLEESIGRPLSTKEARDSVDEVIASLLSTGHHVDKSITDQVCCHWYRSQNKKLKNDVYFWDRHNCQLMSFYRRKIYKNGAEYRIEIHHQDRWRSMSDYVAPFYLMNNPTFWTKYDFLSNNHKSTVKWVRDLPAGSLYNDILK